MAVKYYSRVQLNKEVPDHILKVETVLDIGCGIRPQTYVKPRYHICVEPYAEYVDYLNKLSLANKTLRIVKGTAQEVLLNSRQDEVDSVFLLDVIEHLTKSEARYVIDKSVKAAKNQVVIFTPLGLREQMYKEGETDGWGYHGTIWQTHLSGWTPDDFTDEWELLICEEYSYVDGKGNIYDKPEGVMWAIYTKSNSTQIYASERTWFAKLQLTDRFIACTRILHYLPRIVAKPLAKLMVKVWVKADILIRERVIKKWN